MPLCPRLTGLSQALKWEQTNLFASALELSLVHQGGESGLFQEAKVRIGWDEYGLRIHANLRDESVFTSASADNAELYLLGDVFELFLKLGSREDYFELHVAPCGHRLQLHFPNSASIADIRKKLCTLEDFLVDAPIFDFLVRKTPAGWEVLALIPTAMFDPGLSSLEGSSVQASFSRYDYENLDLPPVLSSTSKHEVLNFHRIHEWALLEMTSSS